MPQCSKSQCSEFRLQAASGGSLLHPQRSSIPAKNKSSLLRGPSALRNFVFTSPFSFSGAQSNAKINAEARLAQRVPASPPSMIGSDAPVPGRPWLVRAGKTGTSADPVCQFHCDASCPLAVPVRGRRARPKHGPCVRQGDACTCAVPLPEVRSLWPGRGQPVCLRQKPSRFIMNLTQAAADSFVASCD